MSFFAENAEKLSGKTIVKRIQNSSFFGKNELTEFFPSCKLNENLMVRVCAFIIIRIFRRSPEGEDVIENKIFLKEKTKMKQKKLFVAIAVIMVLTLSIGVLASCNEKEAVVTYTLRDTMGAGPTNWNPHQWETDADSYFAGYTEMGLVDVTIAEDGVNFEWVYEMAESVTNVTAEYKADAAKAAKWNVTDEAENKVYRIALNQNAKWADGTVINADTYVYSMQQLLDPKMQNYRANTYYNGSAAIMNAAKYFNSSSPIYAAAVPAYEETPDYTKYDALVAAGDPLYVALDKTSTCVSNYSVADLVDMGYVDEDLYSAAKKLANPFGYIEYNDANKSAILSVLDQFLAAFGFSIYADADLNPDMEFLKEFFYYNTGEFSDPYDWNNVGLIKSGEYSIDYICEGEETMFYFLTSLTSNWIVYQPLYDAGKSTVGDIISTTYGTSMETYMSYGPYKLDTYEKDKQMKMSRNENWYGWTDGKHVGQYQTTNVVCDIIGDEATLEGMFLSGKIDALGLNSTQLAKYRNSEYLLQTDQTYTFRWIFASDLTALKNLEATRADGNNVSVLYYDNFRKALSLAMNRSELCAQATGGYKPAFSLFNSLYYYDVENNPESIYRNTEEAKQVVLDLYGIKYGAGEKYNTLDEAYASVTGFDLNQAKTLFQEVYTQAIADGNYTAGQNVVIQCMAAANEALTEDDKAQERLLNEFVTAATVGTGFEGKISFKFLAGAEDRYGDVAAGRIEMIRGAWGGAAFYPFSTIRCYTHPKYMGGLEFIHESCGWNPEDEMLSLTYDFNNDGSVETLEYSLTEWSMLINGEAVGEQAPYTDADTMMFVFAKLEGAVIGAYQCIPWASETACSLFSQKIKYATLDYNIMYGYGGLRLMTYNYTDAEWDAYVASQNNQLKY